VILQCRKFSSERYNIDRWRWCNLWPHQNAVFR